MCDIIRERHVPMTLIKSHPWLVRPTSRIVFFISSIRILMTIKRIGRLTRLDSRGKNAAACPHVSAFSPQINPNAVLSHFALRDSF